MSESFLAAADNRKADASPDASPCIELTGISAVHENPDLLRKIIDALMAPSRNSSRFRGEGSKEKLLAALMPIRAVNKQFHALVRERYPVRVLFRGNLNMVVHDKEDDDDQSGEEDDGYDYDYINDDLAAPDGLDVRMYGHLDLWPPEPSGKVTVSGLYTFSDDQHNDGSIARGFHIGGRLDGTGRMMLGFNFTNTYDPSDDDGVGAEVKLMHKLGTPFVGAWSKGRRRLRRELELTGSVDINWPSEDHPPGVAVLSIKSLDTASFRERTNFRWVSKERATGFIAYGEEARAEAIQLWQSPHPSLLSVKEREELPLFCGWLF